MKRLFIAALAASLWSSAAAAQKPHHPMGFVQVFQLGDDFPDGTIRGADPIGDTFDWGQSTDYPAHALALHHEAAVTIRFTVSADDRMSGCTVVGSQAMMSREGAYMETPASADPELVAKACTILARRGTFRHALHESGRAIPSEVMFLVNFLKINPGHVLQGGPIPMMSMPPREIRAAAVHDPQDLIVRGSAATFPLGRVTVNLGVSGTGTVTGCFINDTSGSDAGDAEACRHAYSLRLDPARDAASQPVDGVGVTLTFTNAR